MPGEGALLDIAAAVADGAGVDWEALERRATTDHERRLVRSLRMVARVGELHSSVDEPAATGSGLNETFRDETLTRADSAERWGRYELRAKIGEGAQGAVFKAWDPQLECEVALKILQPEVAAGDRFGERVLREGRALARVRHPNVVNVYGVETHGDQIALCMEFIRGQTLEDLIRAQGPLGAEEAVTIGVGVGRALAAVHAAGLVHRDVKTRNVMREEKGRIVLMDFGTGRDHAQLARAGAGDLAGTPIYMAPEVLQGSPASQQSDIYSVGVLLYHLVSGRYPVEGRRLDEIVQGHQAGLRVPLAERRPDLPEGFIRVVDRATAPDPAARYASVAMLVHDLVALEPGDAARLAPARSVTERLLAAALWLGAAGIAITLLGFVSSMMFNAVLERMSVASESILDWFVWGLRSLLAPIFNVAQILVLLFALRALWGLVRRFVAPLDRWSAHVATAVRRGITRLNLNQPDAFAQLVLVAGLAYLGLVLVLNWSLVTAPMTRLPSMTSGQRFLLSPANADQHYTYRSALDWLVLGTGVALYRLTRPPTRQAGAGLTSILAVGAVFTMAFLAWGAPYRLFFQADRPRLEYDGSRCYNMGEDAGDLLIYCPDGPQPRVRRVLRSDPAIRDTGVTESVFSGP